MHDEYNGKQHRTVHATSDYMYASRGKHVQKRQEQNKIVQNQKKPVKSKLNTQKTFKTLENEWKPRNTPVGAMEQANNTPRKTESKKNPKTQKKSQNNSPSIVCAYTIYIYDIIQYSII